jgi:hypothetical protein
MCVTATGDLVPISKIKGKYHVAGELAITPLVLLKPMFETLMEIVKICGDRPIYILTPLPRYVLVPCCHDDTHCTNLVVRDDSTREVVLGLMDELETVCKHVKTGCRTALSSTQVIC